MTNDDARSRLDDTTAQPDGVWVVWQYVNHGPHIDSIHATELAALRRANDESYLTATFITFGSNIQEVLR